MWQFHLIEGLKGGERFACYFKIHHAYMDGAKMSARVARVLNRSPEDHSVTPVWCADRSRPKKSRPKKGLAAKLRGAAKSAREVPELIALNLSHVPQALGLTKGQMPVPFSAPKTLLNQPLTPPRALAAADLPLAAVRKVAKAQGVKVNDVLLALCDAALRRYFAERGEPANQALVAQVPIALEQAKGHERGNQITIALIELATAEPDPLARLRQIAANSAQVKKKFSEVSGATAQNYTVLWNTVAEAFNMAGLTGKARPLGNVVISNLPGPKERLYLGGAPVRALYPISTMAPGASLNITIYTYAGQMHFGVIAGRDAIPDLQRLAQYIEDGFEELKTLTGSTDEADSEQATGQV
jgi:diacylglycerol O-acyltransferase